MNKYVTSGGDKCREKFDSRSKEMELSVCVCVHIMGVIALGKVTKGDLFKGVTCRPRLEWKEKGSHRGFQRDIILGARLAVASPEGVEESVEEEEVLPSWAGISGGLLKL